MSVSILRAGLQTTIQAETRTGMRHLGVPASGPADPLSMALANDLVGNALTTPALEATLTGVDLQFETETWFAIVGESLAVETQKPSGGPEANTLGIVENCVRDETGGVGLHDRVRVVGAAEHLSRREHVGEVGEIAGVVDEVVVEEVGRVVGG